MNINLNEWTCLENMLAKDRVIVTNGIDVEVAWVTMRFYYEKKKWSSHFDKELPNGKITHWKYIL